MFVNFIYYRMLVVVAIFHGIIKTEAFDVHIYRSH